MISFEITPVNEVFDPVLESTGIRLLIKREDQSHPHVHGNKRWKLMLNLEEAKRTGKKTMVIFGGAFSNHIYATAAAARESGLKSVGIIRGEKVSPLNPVLEFAVSCGMELIFISRNEYRKKNESEFLAELEKKFDFPYLLPEGGTNALAVAGCAEFGRQLLAHHEFDVLGTAVGTGGTMAGLIRGLAGAREMIGIPVLKRSSFLENDIRKLVEPDTFSNWSLHHGYDHGGYAKVSPELILFIRDFNLRHKIPLDFVYTGKMMWAIMEEIKKGRFRKGTTILMIHTGGLPGASVGNQSSEEIMKDLIEPPEHFDAD